MDDFLCVTVCSRPGESPADFSARLSHFWTHMLRNRLDDFERVYAETTAFEPHGEQLTRKYLVAEETVKTIESELARAGIEHESVDRDELFSKYEAVPPEWMQIEH